MSLPLGSKWCHVSSLFTSLPRNDTKSCQRNHPLAHCMPRLAWAIATFLHSWYSFLNFETMEAKFRCEDPGWHCTWMWPSRWSLQCRWLRCSNLGETWKKRLDQMITIEFTTPLSLARWLRFSNLGETCRKRLDQMITIEFTTPLSLAFLRSPNFKEVLHLTWVQSPALLCRKFFWSCCVGYGQGTF